MAVKQTTHTTEAELERLRQAIVQVRAAREAFEAKASALLQDLEQAAGAAATEADRADADLKQEEARALAELDAAAAAFLGSGEPQ